MLSSWSPFDFIHQELALKFCCSMKTKISIENTTIYFRRRSFQTPNTKEGKAETTVGPLHASYIICIISDHHCFNAFLRRGGLRGTHRAQTSWERASMTLKIMLQKFIDEPLHCGTSSGKPKKNIGCLRLDSWFTPDSSATKKWSMSEGLTSCGFSWTYKRKPAQKPS